ncbi:hypothetical protein H180DRAFT_03354 [Streptomyces sp. WMMB 322]|nr:hypothetical protein H180DRAFT_03354 [Streptomyces sp. WMMB 322]
MRDAWVGPLNWTSGLGETVAPFPAGGGPAREVGEAFPGRRPPPDALLRVDGARPPA